MATFTFERDDERNGYTVAPDNEMKASFAPKRKSLGLAGLTAAVAGIMMAGPNPYGSAYPRRQADPRPPTKQELERNAKKKAQRKARKTQRKHRP